MEFKHSQLLENLENSVKLHVVLEKNIDFYVKNIHYLFISIYSFIPT